ncbi:MAG TPA: DUF4331 domain-containing protein [Gemmatimonadales bacterium]|nr:DUF4331 domain-containing protein [Gemmatimonadales bacterium]
MKPVTRIVSAAALAGLLFSGSPAPLLAASHREAPLTSVDRTADITDFYAFVSYDHPEEGPRRVTLIMGTDPLLEPANGPNYFPFDENVLYSIKVDNNQDALEDVSFELRFKTEFRLPGVPVGVVGAGNGVSAPANSPAPVAPGTPLIPPAITHLDGPGSEGLNLRQTYTVTMVLGSGSGAVRIPLRSVDGRKLIAVPSNAGPRTMPSYSDLFNEGTVDLERDIKVFAGTTDDAFWIDLGAAFDSLNLRVIPGTDVNGITGFGSTGIPGVMTDQQDLSATNFITDSVSGYNVNQIAIEMPIELLTRGHNRPAASDTTATLGTWGVTSRPTFTVRRSLEPEIGKGGFKQIQRMANPLFNELLIATEKKDLWSRSLPKDDAQFASYALDPVVARVAQAAFGGAFDLPTPPRLDLLPLVQYLPPIAAAGTKAGPVADLLRLNVGVAPTAAGSASRLGLIGGDAAGFPNGRRVFDDVTDIVLRVAVGGILAKDADGVSLNRFPNNRLGDGVNVNDKPYSASFPYIAPSHDGRNRRHRDPGEPGGGPIN